MTATAKAIMKRSVSSISSSTTTITATTAAESSSSSIINNKRKKYKMPANINTTSTEDNNDSSLNILIVDDNPINIHILKKSLSKLLNTTTIKRLEEANNGIEALNLLNQYHFDIIFLDIDMPILNGIDTTKCIRKKGQKTPIIAVTTNDSIESRDNYIKIGMVCACVHSIYIQDIYIDSRAIIILIE
jgi:CheY-like chemotaxis protein